MLSQIALSVVTTDRSPSTTEDLSKANRPPDPRADHRGDHGQRAAIDVALFYEGKKYWQGRLGPWDVEQATVPTWRAGGVDIQVTLANGAKLTHPGTYVDGSGNYQIFKIWSDRIEYHPATGSGYLGLTGYGGFALFLDLADLGVRYMTCPVRWAVTSLLY